jgi:hypothetical protein
MGLMTAARSALVFSTGRLTAARVPAMPLSISPEP